MKRRPESLKWKIATWYAALLVVALTATSGILVWSFGTILYQQARDRADSTMMQVLAVANASETPLGLPNAGQSLSPLQVLLNSDNLVYWSSPETSIEIDTPAGYPLVKSANLGGGRIPHARLDAAHPVFFHTERVRDGSAIVEARLVNVGTTPAIVQVSQSLAYVSHAIDEARRVVLIVLAVAICAVILLSIALASQAINPINELSRAMREMGFERLDRRLAWPRSDEIGALAQSFDDLLARLEASFSRERQFISDASHELKTPLTSINANAQMLLRWAERDERVRRESLETIARESSSVGEMVDGMLTLAKADRGDALPKEPVSLIEEARAVVRYAAPRARDKGLDLHFDQASNSAIVLGDANLIRQMIGNLVDNAIKFSDAGTVDVRAGSAERNGWVEVADTGPGIPENDASRIFERFYRADRARSRSIPGTGLGLAIVRSIARVHGGSVDFERRRTGGSLFRVTIPLLALAAALLTAALPNSVRAEEIPSGASPIVNVMLSRGTLVIDTWQRRTVRIVTGGHVSWRRYDANQTALRTPSAIDSWSIRVTTTHGQAILPAEHFVLPPVPAGEHDAIVVRGSGYTTVTIPAGTALVVARVGTGGVMVRGYHGIVVAHVRRGKILLNRFAGTAYAQVVSGHIVARRSTFDRLRARTAIGGLFFEACAARQIDATTLSGPILYDDGTFAEGPAYFSTGAGAIAIGVAGGSLTLEGRSSTQHIALALPKGATVRRNGADVSVSFAGGGAVVTAIAQGSLALYNGRIATHPGLLRAGLPRLPAQDRRRVRPPQR